MKSATAWEVMPLTHRRMNSVQASIPITLVAGSQKSIDYSAEYPEVGKFGFSCVWTAW